ncbi:MAG: response regulator [Acidobacteria bacterium]|nr:response regulator [Acidobacteriota bacterium]
MWRQHRGQAMLAGALSRAAVRGETIERMLELAVRGFLEAGPALRAAVWLGSTDHPQVFVGLVAEAVASFVPEEWKRLDVSAPFFHTLLQSHEPVWAELEEGAGLAGIAPLAGMRSAVWIPLRVQQKTLGLALAASFSAGRGMDTAMLQALADELALAVAQRRDHELAEQRQAELVSREQLQREILRGAPAGQILAQLVREAARETRAEFVALGESSRTRPGGVDFQGFEGARGWAPLLSEEPLAEVWRTALAQGRVVENDLETLRSKALGSQPRGRLLPRERVARVVALPLRAHGQCLGVLVAGLAGPVEPAAELQRLDSYANLAAAALWEEHRRKLGEAAGISSGALLESTDQCLLMLDGEGVIREASPPARRHLESAGAQLGVIRLEDFFSADAREQVAEWRAAASRAVLEVEAAPRAAPLEAALRSGLAVRLHAQPAWPALAEAGGRWQIWMEDLAALRAAEQKSSRAEAELLALLDSVDSGVLLFDTAGRLRLVNDRFGQLLGLETRRLRNLRQADALIEALAGHFLEPQAVAERWRELLDRGDESSWDELELLRPTRKVVERFGRPVLDPAGVRLGWLEVYRDITGQRLIQSKMLQTEKMAALGQLVSGVAHELNNPLTSIMGYAQLLLSRREGAERAADARMIYQEADRAGRIVKNLLLFARETKPERRPVNLNEIVERTLALRSYELKVENIHVILELEPDLPTTLADAAQLQQAVLNLVVNAEQAIQQGRGHGQVRVRTWRLSAQRLGLEVADDGPGIPPEVATRIFDPFFTTKPVGVGTGLGLSIVYGIVHEHGGEVSVESQPGRGTKFVLELPIVAPPAVHRGAEDAASASAARTALEPAGARRESAQPVAAHRETVLVVEDEPTVAQLIADVLREEGYAVETMLDSREALDLVSRLDYSLVICDLKMPHLDGRTFYRALVRAGSPLQHRLIFVTGDTLAAHTLEFLESSGLPFLAKPFLVEELKLVVHRALHGATPGARVSAASENSGWPPAAARK